MGTRTDRLRVGVVGTGAFGIRIGRQLTAVPGTAVVAVADVDADARDGAGDALGVPPDARYADYEAMLDGVSLDAVVVATPHAFHYEQVTAALDRGLDVLSEKPLVVDSDRTRELMGRAERENRVVMVGYQRHLDASFRRARERYAGAGVHPRHVTAEITENWYDTFQGTWRTDPELSAGGFLTDTGRHLVAAILWITGSDPVAVDADMKFPTPRVESRAVVTVEFDHGGVAVVSAFGEAASVVERYQFWDEDGGVVVSGRGWGKRSFAEIDTEGGEHRPVLNRDDERTKGQAFVAAVRDGAPLPATPRDALRTQTVIEAAYESAERNERVAVDLDDVGVTDDE